MADRLIRDLVTSERLVVSAQVLNEFYWTSTRTRRQNPLDHLTAQRAVHSLSLGAIVVPLDASLTFEALIAVERHNIAFWDALIWAAARRAGCTTLYSEDFQNGRTLEGVTFVNPFE